MIVYTTGEKSSKQASFMQHICPGRHLEGQGEMPSDWVNAKNEPIEFAVEFIYGKAEVPDAIGKYLIKHQLAAKTRLIILDRLIA
jgi:hypothetical protein